MNKKLIKEIAYTTLFLMGFVICVSGLLILLLGFPPLLAGVFVALGLVIVCSVYIPLMHQLKL